MSDFRPGRIEFEDPSFRPNPKEGKTSDKFHLETHFVTVPSATPVKTPAQFGAVAPAGNAWPLNQDRSRYALNALYPTIQGEGGQAGTPMVIVRLQGCPIGCVFCDTPESWRLPQEEEWITAEQIVSQVEATGIPWALVTGGEPAWHDLDMLTQIFHERRIQTALETSGTYQLTGAWDWLTVAPHPNGLRQIMDSALQWADEIKWVVGSLRDLDALEQFLVHVDHLPRLGSGTRPRVSVQPMSTGVQATRLCLEWLMRHPWARLSIQSHKYLAIA